MKTYILKVTEDNEHISMGSENDGFTALEVLGMLEFKRNDIIKQMYGKIEPDIVTRNVVETEKSDEDEDI